jgi:hypothetical protein
MLRFNSFPFNPRGAAIGAVSCIIAGFAGCGGTDGVENPKMEIGFEASGAGAVSGRVSLYGKSVNPGEDATPLLTKDFQAGATTEFTPEELDAAIRGSMARQGMDTSGLGDTTVNFNVVAAGGDREAFVGGFSYRRSGGTAGFAKLEGAGSQSSYGHYKNTFGLPKAVKGFTGRIGIYGIGRGIDYVFIPGSPYHASIKKDSTFTIGQMSEGSYTVFGADQDSSKLFESSDTLNTSDTAYSAKAWDTIVFLPD